MNERYLQEIWYGDKPPGMLLSALERVYGQVASNRAQSRALKQPDDLLGKPIIVVGNITAGGTGKTPLVLRLCEVLQEAGLSVAVISRGYGRQGSGPVTVTANSDVADAGDEPLLIARRCGVTVYVDSDREAAARRAFAAGIQVVLSDDGLQRGQLPRIMELCVIDGSRGLGNGRLLPAGPLREAPSRLDTVDQVIINGAATGPLIPNNAIRMNLEPRVFKRIDGQGELSVSEGVDQFGGRAVSAIAGIGNPQRFFSSLRKMGLNPSPTQAFKDHHAYSSADLAPLADNPVLMTEKDAGKVLDAGLTREQLANCWYLQVDARLPSAWEAGFVQEVKAHSGNMSHE